MDPARDWQLIVPIKPTSLGKSRLAATGGGSRLAAAIAEDTVTAAAECPLVEAVFVVTADRELGASLSRIERVHRVTELAPRGIAAAVDAGLAAVGVAPRLAVLLGDLPVLDPAELAEALAAAQGQGRAFVPDAEGTGTTMVTADGVRLLAAFGPGSAAAHRVAGLVALELPAASGLRLDLDTPERLDELAGRFGPATRAVLAPRESTG